MMSQSQISMIKLVNSDTIIATIDSRNKDGVFLLKPAKIYELVKPTPEMNLHIAINLAPWFYTQYTNKTCFVPHNKIITATEPASEIKEQYVKNTTTQVQNFQPPPSPNQNFGDIPPFFSDN